MTSWGRMGGKRGEERGGTSGLRWILIAQSGWWRSGGEQPRRWGGYLPVPAAKVSGHVYRYSLRKALAGLTTGGVAAAVAAPASAKPRCNVREPGKKTPLMVGRCMNDYSYRYLGCLEESTIPRVDAVRKIDGEPGREAVLHLTCISRSSEAQKPEGGPKRRPAQLKAAAAALQNADAAPDGWRTPHSVSCTDTL